MKKKNVTLVLTIIFMIALVVAASYAYFASSESIEGNIAFETIFDPVKPSFTSHVEKDVSLQVHTLDMIDKSIGTSKSDNGTIVIEFLSGKDNSSAICWYDINYIWDSGAYSPTHTLPIIDEENNKTYNYELSLKGTRTTTGDSGYTYEDKNLVETNIDKLNWIDEQKQTAKLVEGAEIHNQSSTTPSITTWTFTMSLYSLPTTQNELLNKSYNGHLVITNVRC